ncbi:hypothetical protein [Streptomyces longwoodensis]|uniref:hypothetical protein n=1 Tax=Streptomyces longwoodensis TaxID=68231 RepID=UPI0036F7C451
MDQATLLTPDQIETAVADLRVGRTATEAADAAGVTPDMLYAAARHNGDLLLALAGQDPYAQGAEQALQQADYVRLMALGFKPTEAARVLFHGDERVKGWRAKNPNFARIADTVRELCPPTLTQRREHRFTSDRIRVFLEGVTQGLTTPKAAERAGVTAAVIYQRRRRDRAFREAMEAARARALELNTPPPPPVSDEQWQAFRHHLASGKTLRRAALDSGIKPQRVYDRRSSDHAFRMETNAWRQPAS